MVMKRKFLLRVAALLFALVISGALNAQDAQKDNYVKGDLLVQLTRAGYEKSTLKQGGKTTRTGITSLDALLLKNGLVSAEPLYKIPPKNRELDDKYGLSRTFIVKIAPSADIPKVAREVAALSEVEYAELNHIFRFSSPVPSGMSLPSVSAVAKAPAPKNNFPNDPYFYLQWSHENLGNVIPYGGGSPVGAVDCDADTKEAWSITTGSSNVTIAFIDSGIDLAHAQLGGEFYGRLLPGYDFGENDSNPNDVAHGHGTIVAGTAAAKGNNGVGIAGVDWNCKIMPLKIIDDDNNFVSGAIESSIVYAADHGADIISMSFGWFNYDPIMENFVNYAFETGCVLFAASGNQNDCEKMHYPAAFKNVIAVGALSPCDTRKRRNENFGCISAISCDKDTRQDTNGPWASNYGTLQDHPGIYYYDSIDFVAPAVLLPTTDVKGPAGYSEFDNYYQSDENGDYLLNAYGTSIAAPFAAGVAGLMLAVNPELTNVQIRDILRNTSVDIQAPGFDSETGYGRINALAAVQAAQGCPDNLTFSNEVIPAGDYKANNLITLAASVFTQGIISFRAGKEVVISNLTMTPGSQIEASVQPEPCGEGYIVSKNINSDEIVKQSASDAGIQNGATTVESSVNVYPNPFSDELFIAYTIEDKADVSLFLYDRNGIQIADVRVKEQQERGKHVLRFDGSKLPTGMYLYRLKIGEKTEQGRILKVR